MNKNVLNSYCKVPTQYIWNNIEQVWKHTCAESGPTWCRVVDKCFFLNVAFCAERFLYKLVTQVNWNRNKERMIRLASGVPFRHVLFLSPTPETHCLLIGQIKQTMRLVNTIQLCCKLLEIPSLGFTNRGPPEQGLLKTTVTVDRYGRLLKTTVTTDAQLVLPLDKRTWE